MTLHTKIVYAVVQGEELIATLVYPNKALISSEASRKYKFDTSMTFFCPAKVVRDENINSETFGQYRLRKKFDLTNNWFMQSPTNFVQACQPCKEEVTELYLSLINRCYQEPISYFLSKAFPDFNDEVDILDRAEPVELANSWLKSIETLMVMKQI
jgi:hypothetical protein